MERVKELHRQLYNAALEERIDAWRKLKKSISYYDQNKSLTIIRRNNPEYLAVNAQSTQLTLKRLDNNFKSFFLRVKRGKTPGFPRFKPKDRFPGFGFQTHGNGFRFTPRNGWKHGKIRLSGIGTMTARGEARTPGRIVCADIMHKIDGWYLSIVVECEPHRERGEREAGLDWGVETFATLAYDPFTFVEFENDRPLSSEYEALKTEQRTLSAALRGKRTKRAMKARKAMARRWRKVANRRKNLLHKVTAQLVFNHSLIITEKLAVKNMTASAKGTVEKPGKNVKQKAGLNRAILDAAPRSFLNMLQCKAEEAGCAVICLNTRKHRPSQTDPISGEVKKKALSERTHVLPDGRIIGRDQAAALSMLRAGLKLLGREPAWVQETATEPTVRAA